MFLGQQQLSGKHLGAFLVPSFNGVGDSYGETPNVNTYNDQNIPKIDVASRARGAQMYGAPPKKQPDHTIGKFNMSPFVGCEYKTPIAYEMRDGVLLHVLGNENLKLRSEKDTCNVGHQRPFLPGSGRSLQNHARPSYLGQVSAADVEYERNRVKTKPRRETQRRQIQTRPTNTGGPGTLDRELTRREEYIESPYEITEKKLLLEKLPVWTGYRNQITRDGKVFGPQRMVGDVFDERIWTDTGRGRSATHAERRYRKHPNSLSFSSRSDRCGSATANLRGTFTNEPTYMSNPYSDNPWKDLSSIERRATRSASFKCGRERHSTMHGEDKIRFSGQAR